MKHVSNLVPSMLNVKTQASSNCFGSFWTKKKIIFLVLKLLFCTVSS